MPAFTVRSSNQHLTLEAGSGTSESSFWKNGKKPNDVSDFGTDRYGAWYEFQIPYPKSPSGHVAQRMRWIPAGTFLMGSPEDEEGRYGDESPQHRVTLTRGFWMADTPCTQEVWEAITGKNPSEFKGEQLPVETVSWEDVEGFIQETSGKFPALGLSLPSEAQWEYACRAGSETRYCVGDELTPEHANFGRTVGKTTEVKAYPCNDWGLYDVHGNVWQWCQDWQGDYESDEQVDPSGPPNGSSRVFRGGSWIDSAQFARSAYRNWYLPGNRYDGLGFRCLSSVNHQAQAERESASTRELRDEAAEKQRTK